MHIIAYAVCSHYYTALCSRLVRNRFVLTDFLCSLLQDPSYPAYVDTSVMMGMTGEHNGIGFDNVAYMQCKPENNFFPDLSKVSTLYRCAMPVRHRFIHPDCWTDA